MAGDKSVKDAFDRRRAGAAEAAPVPESIKNHALEPVLKPDGSWRARADAVDQAVREARDAAKAQNEWTKRLKKSLRHGKGFNMRARS